MLLTPNNVVFSNEYDIVDWVCRGLPPRKTDFERVMDELARNYRTIPVRDTTQTAEQSDQENAEPTTPPPTPMPQSPIKSGNGTVTISHQTLDQNESELLESVLRQVYKDRCQTRNTLLIAGGVVAAFAGLFMIMGHSGGHDKDCGRHSFAMGNDDGSVNLDEPTVVVEL